MRILLAADGSEYTKRAAKYLAQHISAFAQAPKVHVLNVHPPMPYAGAGVPKKAVEAYQREECEKALAVATRELKKAGIDYKASWVVGDVAEEIRSFVKKQGIELVVMGSHGHGAFASMALGSVATKVLATVKTPVLIIR